MQPSKRSISTIRPSISKSRASAYETPNLLQRKLSRTHRVSYAVKKAFTQGGTDENSILAEVEQGFTLDGDIQIVSQIEGTQEILCISYTETFDHIGLGLTDGTIRLLNAKTGEFTSTLRDDEIVHSPGPTTAIKHRPVQGTHPITQTLTATYATGSVKCWHYPTKRCLYTIREQRQTLGLAYHPTLPKFVTVGDDTKLCFYDEETQTQERILQASNSPHVMNGHRSRVFAACFHPQKPHELISGGWDNTIQFWDIREPHSSRYISGVHICGDSLDISDDGSEILTCAWTQKDCIQLWDYGTGSLIATLKPDPWDSLLYTGKYVGSYFAACGGCETNLFRIIDLRSRTTLGAVRNLSGGVYCMDIGRPSTKQHKRTLRTPPLPKIAFCSGKCVFEVEAMM